MLKFIMRILFLISLFFIYSGLAAGDIISSNDLEIHYIPFVPEC